MIGRVMREMGDVRIQSDGVMLPKWMVAALFVTSIGGAGYYLGVTIQLQIDVAVMKNDISTIKHGQEQILDHLTPKGTQP